MCSANIDVSCKCQHRPQSGVIKDNDNLTAAQSRGTKKVPRKFQLLHCWGVHLICGRHSLGDEFDLGDFLRTLLTFYWVSILRGFLLPWVSNFNPATDLLVLEMLAHKKSVPNQQSKDPIKRLHKKGIPNQQPREGGQKLCGKILFENTPFKSCRRHCIGDLISSSHNFVIPPIDNQGTSNVR